MGENRLLSLRDLDESSSDDDDHVILCAAQIIQSYSQVRRQPGGSVPGRAYIYRDREAGHARMYQDYLAENPTYGPNLFRRRFRMNRPLFLRILNAVEQHDDYFEQKRNAAHQHGLSCFQKVTAVFRMLTYGVAADATDEYVRIGESTTLESLRRFVKVVIEVFGDEYLRSPNEKDIERLLALGNERGFPGMLEGPKVNYKINNHEYTMGYYLADGIYPSWATLVKTIPEPRGNKRTYFAKAQEAARKDVERAFGVLQSRFAIVRGPARLWDEETLNNIMISCIIMHNMIIEDEKNVDPKERFENGGDNVQPSHDVTAYFDEFLHNHRKIRNHEAHYQLREDLVEHLWQHHPDLYS
ncbi:uncharacterized protein [Zea mays]|uniref:uncharacterized protein n=1 Tax=Zea mays TaxID=4577 RepID=UPI0009A9DA98|nr:uncharacterized protein LOC109941826 [Zea mays]|eukprot:XP_020398640.1 uncharacterized protein LOC109941826 [Zea mays]